MSDISINTSALGDKESKFKNMSRRVGTIQNSLGILRWEIDSDIKSRQNIDRRMSNLFTELGDLAARLSDTAKVVEESRRRYENAERELKKRISDLTDKPKSHKGWFSRFIDRIKSLITKRVEKALEIMTLMGLFGPVPQLISNIHHLKDFFNKRKSSTPANQGMGKTGKISEGGPVKDVLAHLPGGAMPTQEELKQIDSILDKYESQLIKLYDHDVSDTDIASILNEMAQELTPIFNKHRYDFTWWYYIVKPYGALDVKNSRKVTIDGKEIKIWNQNWNYAGTKYAGDFAGNMLYGYLGVEMFGTGFLGQSVIKGGAGAGQYLSDRNNKIIKSSPLKKYMESMVRGDWGDNPGDSAQIQVGIDSYIRKNSYNVTVIDISRVMPNPFNPLKNIDIIIHPSQLFEEVHIEKEPGLKRDVELMDKIISKLKKG